MLSWPALQSEAISALPLSYSPYSNYPVAAAALASDPYRSAPILGVNMENASLGLTCCAEVSVLQQLQLLGGPRLTRLVIVDSTGISIPPCGRCLQLLLERDADCRLLIGHRPDEPIHDSMFFSVRELLPVHFRL